MEPTTQTTQTNLSKKIIIVEDNSALAEIYRTRLELLGYTCFLAYNGITGLYFIQKEQPDLVLLDLMVPDIAGDQILARMRGSTWGKDIPVFIISNLNEEDAPAGLRDLGIAGYAVKMNMHDNDIDNIVAKILGVPAAASPPPETTSGSMEPLSAPQESVLQPLPVVEPPEQRENLQ